MTAHRALRDGTKGGSQDFSPVDADVVERAVAEKAHLGDSLTRLTPLRRLVAVCANGTNRSAANRG